MPTDEKESELLASHPLLRAEHEEEDKAKMRRRMPTIKQVIVRIPSMIPFFFSDPFFFLIPSRK